MSYRKSEEYKEFRKMQHKKWIETKQQAALIRENTAAGKPVEMWGVIASPSTTKWFFTEEEAVKYQDDFGGTLIHGYTCSHKDAD